MMNSFYEGTKRRFLREGREEVRVEGREEGIMIGESKRIDVLTNAVSSVMQKLNLSLEEALEVTNISDDDRPLITDRLSSM